VFLSAARSGDVDTVIQCLAGGNVDVNVSNAVSSTTLIQFCLFCRFTFSIICETSVSVTFCATYFVFLIFFDVFFSVICVCHFSIIVYIYTYLLFCPAKIFIHSYNVNNKKPECS